MRCTLLDCLQLDVLRDVQIAAGSAALSHRVKTVTVLETSAEGELPAGAANEDELVLCRFFGVEEDTAEQLRIISILAQADSAGLLVIGSDKLRQLDPSVRRAAERAGLSLLFLPRGCSVPLGSLISHIMGRVLYGDNFGNKLISNTIFHLLNFERHSNFEAALREAAVNNNFQVILLSENFEPVLTVETRHRVTIADAINVGRGRELGASAVYTMIDVNGVLTYWGPVNIEGEEYFMFIVDNEDSYTAADITKLAEIIELAMGMWKYTPKRDVRTEFVKALRRGSRDLAYSIRDEAGIPEENMISVFYVSGGSEGFVRGAIADFEQKNAVDVIRMSEGGDSYGVILGKGDGRANGFIDEAAACIRLFGEMKEESGIRVFHTTQLDGISGASDAFRVINECRTFAQTVFPYKRVFSKYELALVSNCVNIQLSGGFVKKNYLELLESFNSVGKNKSRQLLDTLETFVLDAGMNSAKTSEFMGIHTNTVQYRLKKINEILGVEVTGNRVLPGLTLALALKRLERLVR